MTVRTALRTALATLLFASLAAGGTPAAAAPTFQLPVHPVPLPRDGNVTFVRFTYVATPLAGHAFPSGASVHVFIAHTEQLPGSVLVTGAAVSTHTRRALRFDGFLAMLNRAGGPDGTAPQSFFLGVNGISRSAIGSQRSSFRAYENVLGRRLSPRFCSAIARDARHPTAVGFVDVNPGDNGGAISHLALARASARLCNGGAVAGTGVNVLLKEIGRGLIGSAAAAFAPQTLAGTWQGSWNDTRFGTSGPLSLVLTVKDQTSFDFTLNFGGNIFGCPPQPALTLTITAGSGANHWDASGFRIQVTGPSGGSISVNYDFATQTLSGNGRPGCRPGVTWTLKGGFNGVTFNGQMTTTLEDGSTAPAVITMKKTS